MPITRIIRFKDRSEGINAGNIEFHTIDDYQFSGKTAWYSKVMINSEANRYLGRGKPRGMLSRTLHQSDAFDTKEEVIANFEEVWGDHFEIKND